MNASDVPVRILDHCVFFEPPDLLVFDVGVEVTTDVAKQVIEFQTEMAKGKKYLLLLCRVKAFKTMHGDARAIIANPRVRMPPTAAAFVGASFQGRVFVDMLFRAVRYFGKRDVIVRLFDEEKDARAWLFGTMRKELSG